MDAISLKTWWNSEIYTVNNIGAINVKGTELIKIIKVIRVYRLIGVFKVTTWNKHIVQPYVVELGHLRGNGSYNIDNRKNKNRIKERTILQTRKQQHKINTMIRDAIDSVQISPETLVTVMYIREKMLMLLAIVPLTDTQLS